MEIQFFQPPEIGEDLFRYAVILARYKDKWIFSRHRARSTWEIPGGHRETGESVEKTARRELWEETGAVDFELRPVAAYHVTDYGMLYFASVTELGELPEDSEMVEILLADMLPLAQTYPEMHSAMFHEVQKWLTLQSNANEIWDIYDENRQLTGRTQRRGDPMKPGDYHLCVHIWMQNSRGEFLITKRSPNKGFPNMWETTGGSALAGDDSLTAACREVREETGLVLDVSRGKVLFTVSGDNYICDVWLFRQEFSLDDVVLQEGETCGAKYANSEEIRNMLGRGTFVPHSYIPRFLDRIGAGL